MEKIYIRKDSVITGPYAVNQLHQCNLKSSDKIWYEGLTEWQPALKVDFIKQYLSTARSGFFFRMLGVR